MGIPLALDPLHPMLCAERGCVGTLGQALDIGDALDPEASGAPGVAVDVYHCWRDPLPAIRGWMEGAEFAGHVEVEIFSDAWSSRPAEEVPETCLERDRCRA
jgi:hypothetical protein